VTVLKAIFAAYGPRPFVNAVVFTAALVVLILSGQPTVHADPFTNDAASMCAWLDEDSSPESIVLLVLDMQAAGLTSDQIVATGGFALRELCPEYQDEWMEANNIVNGKKRYTA
jgi:hypothetical protein